MISAFIGLLQEDAHKIFFFLYLYSFNIISLASEHGSVVMDVRQVAQRLVVQVVLNVYCVFGQGPFSSSFSLPR